LEQCTRFTLSAAQLRDSIFSQIFRRPHTLATSSSLSSSRSDYRKSVAIYVSEFLPKIALRVQELRGRYVDRSKLASALPSSSTSESSTFVTDSNANDDRDVDHTIDGDDSSSSPSNHTILSNLSPFITYFFALENLEQSAHSEVLLQEYDKLVRHDDMFVSTSSL
jgi:hypothetical protein